MQLGMVGLGRMGANMTKRLLERGHELVVFDRNQDAMAASAAEGAVGASSLVELVRHLAAPRHVWLMVPSGEPTRETITTLAGLLDPGDVIVDGGNSPWKDAPTRNAELAERGVTLVDAGVSGGVWGLKIGYCLMVGGDADAVQRLEPIFLDLAPEDGYAHVGPSGAGHFVKMVHNGIEYGMLQAYAEGFALMDAATELELDLHQVAGLWQHGSVVRSWLLDLAELALSDQKGFAAIKGYVEDSGEGRWTIEEAIDRGVAAPVITAALFARFSSRQPNSYAARIVAALRNQFGGHKFFTEAAAAEAQKEEQGEAPGIITSEAEAAEAHGPTE
ncbi:MAG: 6-phosphogluconate dehydrogenase [Actinomycetota bacterium]|jgi:6-phosphogluconate dehydrogenase|nr:6-phosphogluconate dehydrogenase [Actinomycetota bacterium]